MYRHPFYVGPLTGDAQEHYRGTLTSDRPRLCHALRVDHATCAPGDCPIGSSHLLAGPSTYAASILGSLFHGNSGAGFTTNIVHRRDAVRWRLLIAWSGAPSVARVAQHIIDHTPHGTIANVHLSRYATEDELDLLRDAVRRSWGELPPEQPAWTSGYYGCPASWPSVRWSDVRLHGVRLNELLQDWLRHNVCPDSARVLGPLTPFPPPDEHAIAQLFTKCHNAPEVGVYALQLLGLHALPDPALAERSRQLTKALRRGHPRTITRFTYPLSLDASARPHDLGPGDSADGTTKCPPWRHRVAP